MTVAASAPRIARIADRVRAFASATLLYAMLWLVLATGLIALLGGLEPIVIGSGSMSPAVRAGDVILVQPPPEARLGPGAVITFRNDGLGRERLVTHRVFAVTGAGYITKGDANAGPDSDLVALDDVVGVGRVLVPFVGLPAHWATTGAWLPLAVWLAVTVVSIVTVWPSGRRSAGGLGSGGRGVRVPVLRATPWQPRRAGVQTAKGMGALLPVLALLVTGLVAPWLTGHVSGAVWTDVTTNPGNVAAADTLAPPTNVSGGCGTPLTITWNRTNDAYAAGHRVLRSATSGGPYTQIAEVTPRAIQTYDDAPAAGTYYYVLRSFFQNWESVDTAETIGIAAPTCGTFIATADASVQQEHPTDRYGTEDKLQVQTQTGSKNIRTLVRFDVSSIPGTATVDMAILTLCATKVPSVTRTYDLYRVGTDWTESTVTWATQPGASILTTSTATPAQPACVNWVVTADAQAWVSGTANYGWLLRDSVENDPIQGSDFRSRSAGQTPPTLKVAYTP